jgi:hypothetical protein
VSKMRQTNLLLFGTVAHSSLAIASSLPRGVGPECKSVPGSPLNLKGSHRSWVTIWQRCVHLGKETEPNPGHLPRIMKRIGSDVKRQLPNTSAARRTPSLASATPPSSLSFRKSTTTPAIVQMAPTSQARLTVLSSTPYPRRNRYPAPRQERQA